MTTFIKHPDEYKVGTRVMFSVGRPKDGVLKHTSVPHVTRNVREFDRAIKLMWDGLPEGHRIYSSASRRAVHKAARLFRERQLAAEYDSSPLAFYEDLNGRWVSALMAKQSSENKLWMFDCDSVSDAEQVLAEYRQITKRDPYSYKTKNGTHMIVPGFDKSRLSDDVRAMLDENPSMLWAY